MSFFERIGAAIGRRVARETVSGFLVSGEFKEHVNKKLNAGIDATLKRILAEPQYRWFWFVKGIQAEMLRVDPTMRPADAFYRARNIYHELLADEKIEFGDPHYDWSDAAARDIAHLYEIDHWEARA